MYSFEYVKGQGLKAEINKDKLAELMEEEREDARQENLEYQEECKNEREDWDCKDSDYL